MKHSSIIVLGALVTFINCKDREPDKTETMEQWKSEIVQVEQDFNDMAQEKGLTEAFYHFAAEDGVIKRSNKVVAGRDSIKEWYKKDVRPDETLTWQPTFVEVSKSGDLAYTYGDYVYTSRDSTGARQESTGIFHTVWKRQDDGSWKFVWD